MQYERYTPGEKPFFGVPKVSPYFLNCLVTRSLTSLTFFTSGVFLQTYLAFSVVFLVVFMNFHTLLS